MNSNQFQELKTKRLLLRRLNTSDWKVISFLRSDEEVNKFVKRPTAKTKEKALKFISKINNGIDDGNLFYWAITEKDTDRTIGTICLWNFSKDKKTAEIGFDLRPKFQGKGLMTECLKSILYFGFNKLDLNSVTAYTQRENENSKKLLERNSFECIDGIKDEHNEDNIVYELRKENQLDFIE